MRVVELDGSSPLHWLLFRGEHPTRGEGGGLETGSSISGREGPAAAPGEDELGKFWELLDPDTQPVMPVPGCSDSQKIFQEHKEMARKYLVLQQEIYNLCQEKKKLADQVASEESRQLQKQSLYQDKIRQLQHKGDLLRNNHSRLRAQLDKINGSGLDSPSGVSSPSQYHMSRGSAAYQQHYTPLPRAAPAPTTVPPQRLPLHDQPSYYQGYHQPQDSKLPPTSHELASPDNKTTVLRHNISAVSPSSSSGGRCRPETHKAMPQHYKPMIGGHQQHHHHEAALAGPHAASGVPPTGGGGGPASLQPPLLTGPPVHENALTGPPGHEVYFEPGVQAPPYHRTAFAGPTSTYSHGDYHGPGQGGAYAHYDQFSQPHQTKYSGLHKSHLNYPQNAPD